jgi:DMSO reductase anchor subunit
MAAPDEPAPGPAAGRPDGRPWFVAAAVLAAVLFFTAALVGAFHLGKDSRAGSAPGVESAR